MMPLNDNVKDEKHLGYMQNKKKARVEIEGVVCISATRFVMQWG